MPRKRGRKSRNAWGSNDDAGAGRRRLRFWADLHDGKGYTRHSRTIVGTKRDGDLELARIRLEHAEDRPVPTLGQAWDMWYLPELEERLDAGEIAPRTVTVYKSTWSANVSDRWSSVPVTGISPLDVQDWVMSLTKDQARRALMIMRCVLDKCRLYGTVDDNVAERRYRMPKTVERARSKDVYTLAQTVEAIEAARGTPAYIPAIMCGIASCRPSEALGPMRSEVRRERVNGMIVAVVDLVRQAGKGESEDREALKNPQSARPVVIPEPWSLDVLEQPGPWLCDRGDGTPCRQWKVNDSWGRALEDAGMVPIPMRNLRNSWRTYMRWELGVDEDMLESMMGHAGKNVGERHYDRPRWEVYADVVTSAWLRFRAGEKIAVGTNWDKRD